MRDLEGAIHYVLHEQGEPMSVYEGRDLDVEAIFRRAQEYAPLADARGSDLHPTPYNPNQSRDHQGANSNIKRTGGARLFAVVTTRPGQQGRFYRLPTERDLAAVRKAAEELERRKAAHTGPLSLTPDEPTPLNDGHRAVGSVVLYGMDKFEDLFTPRQLLALTTLVNLVQKARTGMDRIKDNGIADAVLTCLAITVDRQANTLTSLSHWHLTRENIEGVFARQALPMVWDFVEANSFSGATGDLEGAIEWVANFLQANIALTHAGHTEITSATSHPLPDDAAHGFVTDPPYYDAVPYADLADFFFVWLKRTLRDIHPDLFGNELTPKSEQAIVWHPGSSDEKREYEKKMYGAMSEGRRILTPSGIGIVVFAHKSTVGWEAQLQSMVDAGWTITGSWPIDTEMGSRMNAMGTASLASSIHLVCRPREHPDGSLRTDNIGDWRDVLQELPRRIHEWLPRLAQEGVVGADAIFACLGPALEIFSRYSSVEKASGEQISLREYLEHVWAAVAREALSMVFEGGDATGFEEDARLTAMWLWTLSTGDGNGQSNDDDKADDDDEAVPVKASTGYTLEFDATRKIAQGLGAHLEQLDDVVEVKGDKARLLSVAERADTLFTKEEIRSPGAKRKKASQLNLFAVGHAEESEEGWSTDDLISLARGDTVMDRVHQSMILFAAGRSDAMRRMLVEDGIGQDQRFWRLAQALSALYPSHTDEKRWVDGVLARKKSLGF